MALDMTSFMDLHMDGVSKRTRKGRIGRGGCDGKRKKKARVTNKPNKAE